MEKYLKQVDFAKLTEQAPSRINLLIKKEELDVTVIAGVTFVNNTAKNRKRAEKIYAVKKQKL